MFWSKPQRSPLTLIWALAISLFILKTIWVASTPVRGLASTTWIIDDSFIEMRVARNIGLGIGYTFDGTHPTTGTPPLWTYISSIPHALFAEDIAIKMTFILSAFFGMLATVVVFAIARRVTGRSAVAWISFALASLTGTAFFDALNGMETALFTLLVLLTVATFLGIGKPNRWSPMSWGLVVGACGGLLLLTRADGIFLLVPLVLLQLSELIQAKQSLERKIILQHFIGMLIGFAIGFFLLVGWQYALSGSPRPANQIGRREMALALHGFSYDSFSLARYLRVVIWNIFQLENLLSIAIGGSLLGLMGLAFGFTKREMRPLGFITLVYLGLYFATLVAYQWYFPDFHGLRYLDPAAHLLAIFIAWLIWALPEHRAKWLSTSALTASVIVLTVYLHYQLTSRMPWGKELSYIGRPTAENLHKYWDSLDWIRENIPEGTLVGVRDHGRFSMFTNLPTQDLAGNMDATAALKVRDGSLPQYLKDRGVQYLYIPTPETRNDPVYQEVRKLKLTKVEGQPENRERTLYKIDWASNQ